MNRKDFEHTVGTGTAKWFAEERGQAWFVSPPTLHGESLEDIKRCHTVYEAVACVFGPKSLQDTITACEQAIRTSERDQVMMLMQACVHMGAKNLMIEFIKYYNITSADERLQIAKMYGSGPGVRSAIWMLDLTSTYTHGDASLTYTITFAAPVVCKYEFKGTNTADMQACVDSARDVTLLCQGAKHVSISKPTALVELVNIWVRLITPPLPLPPDVPSPASADAPAAVSTNAPADVHVPTPTNTSTERTYAIHCSDGISRPLKIVKDGKKHKWSFANFGSSGEYYLVHKIMERLDHDENPETLIARDLSTWSDIAMWMGKADIARKMPWREFEITPREICSFSRYAPRFRYDGCDQTTRDLCESIYAGKYQPPQSCGHMDCRCISKLYKDQYNCAYFWVNGSIPEGALGQDTIDHLIKDRKRWH